MLKRLKEAGFIMVSQKGSHIKMRHPDGRMAIVPSPKKDLPPGTLHSIEEQARMKF